MSDYKNIILKAGITSVIAVLLDYLFHFLPSIGQPTIPEIYYGAKIIIWFLVAFFGFYLSKLSIIPTSLLIGGIGAFASGAFLTYYYPYSYSITVHMAHMVTIFIGAVVSEKAID